MRLEQQTYAGEIYAPDGHPAEMFSVQPDPVPMEPEDDGHTDEIDALMARGIGAAVGLGRPPDRIEAHCWFNIAAARGSRHAMRLRQELAQEMTPDEIAHAQRRARAYLAPKAGTAA